MPRRKSAQMMLLHLDDPVTEFLPLRGGSRRHELTELPMGIISTPPRRLVRRTDLALTLKETELMQIHAKPNLLTSLAKIARCERKLDHFLCLLSFIEICLLSILL